MSRITDALGGNYQPGSGLASSLGSVYATRQNELNTVMASRICLGSTTISEEDILKFRKMLEFMDFALAASDELRALMVAFEAKQRLLK